MTRNLYKIISESVSEKGAGIFEVQLNIGCEIFNGHFPGQPVLPGVCTIEIVKECIGKMMGYKVMLNGISQCKFTGMVDPRLESVLTVNIEINKGAVNSVNAIVSASQRVILKLKGEFKEINNGE